MPPVIHRYHSQEDLIAIIRESADYDVGCGDLTKVQAFIAAVRVLISETPQRMTHGGRGGEELMFDLKTLRDMLNDATDWRDWYYRQENARSDSGVVAFDLSGFREY